MLRSLAISLLLLAGCQDYLFAPVCPLTKTEAKIIGETVGPTAADILFVVDNSGSMADDQKRLAESFDAFINQLAAVEGLDYQIAIVTTDLDAPSENDPDPQEKAGEVTFTFKSEKPYELMGSNNAACTKTGIPHGCFRGPLITSKMSVLEQDQAFNNIVTVGSCGSGNEQGLAAAIRALTSDCNQGFIRQDPTLNTNLVIIYVSDEQDQSPGDVSQYVSQLGNIASQNGKDWSKVRAVGIIGAVDGRAASCTAVGGQPSTSCGSLCNECPGASWCDSVIPNYWANGGCGFCSFYQSSDCCSAAAGGRYQQFLEQVDRQVKASGVAVGTATLIDSICQHDFSATLKRIAAEIIITRCYPLRDSPLNPDGIAASISPGGRELVRGVDFNVDNGEVCLTETTELQRGEKLEISYLTEEVKRPSPHEECN